MNVTDVYLDVQAQPPGHPASPHLLSVLLGITEAVAADRNPATRQTIHSMLTGELLAERARRSLAWSPDAATLDRPHNGARQAALAAAIGQELSWLACRKLAAKRKRRRPSTASKRRAAGEGSVAA